MIKWIVITILEYAFYAGLIYQIFFLGRTFEQSSVQFGYYLGIFLMGVGTFFVAKFLKQ